VASWAQSGGTTGPLLVYLATPHLVLGRTGFMPRPIADHPGANPSYV
jgi:hypothetical protein